MTPAQIKVAVDSNTGQFKFEPRNQKGEKTAQYVPDLMKSPSELTYVFDEPKDLERLILKLCGADQAGRRLATAAFTAIRQMKFQVTQDARHGAEDCEHNGGREDTIDTWLEATTAMPERHAVTEVQLELSPHGQKTKEIEQLVETIKKVLSAKAGRSVRCFVVNRDGNGHSG